MHTLRHSLIGGEIRQDRGGASEPQRRGQQSVCRGKTKEDLHRWFALLSVPQSVTLLHWGKPVLDIEAQDLQVRPRERIGGEPHGDTLKGARVWNPTTKKVQEEAWAHQRGKALFLSLFLFGRGWLQGEGRDHHRSFFLQVHALRQQGTVQGSSNCKYELPLSSLTPEAVTSIDCCCSGGS